MKILARITIIIALALTVSIAGTVRADDLGIVVAEATGAAKALIAASDKVLIWYQVDPNHPDASLWLKRFMRAVPAYYENGGRFREASSHLTKDDQKRHGKAIIALGDLVTEASRKFHEVASIVKIYGLPSKELRLEWKKMHEHLKDQLEQARRK